MERSKLSNIYIGNIFNSALRATLREVEKFVTDNWHGCWEECSAGKLASMQSYVLATTITCSNR